MHHVIRWSLTSYGSAKDQYDDHALRNYWLSKLFFTAQRTNAVWGAKTPLTGFGSSVMLTPSPSERSQTRDPFAQHHSPAYRSVCSPLLTGRRCGWIRPHRWKAKRASGALCCRACGHLPVMRSPGYHGFSSGCGSTTRSTAVRLITLFCRTCSTIHIRFRTRLNLPRSS